MSRVGKNTVASVATIMCIVFILSIVLPFSGAQSTDTTPPYTVANVSGTPGNNGWYKGIDPPNVTLTAIDNGSGVAHTYYRLDGGAQVEYSSDITVPDGNHTLAFWSVDNAGNTEPLSASHNYLSFKVDTISPTMNRTINGKLNSTTGSYNGNTTVNLTAYDNNSGISSIQYSFTGTSWMPYTGNITILDGVNTLYYGCYDNAGNVYNNSTVISVFDPVILTSPPYNTWYDHYLYGIQFVKPASDDVKYIQYAYYDVWYTYDMDSPIPFSIFDHEGNRSIRYRAIGRSGDVSDIQPIWFGIDINPPTIKCWIEGRQSSSGWYDGDITVHIDANDNGSINKARTEWSWDKSNWNHYESPFKLSNQGSKTIYYRTVDMFDRPASGEHWIYFAPGSYDQGSMSNSVWINGVLYGPSSGTSSSGTSTPRPTSTPVPLPTPALVPSPTPATETSTGSSSPLALAVLIGVLAIIIVAAAAAYFFMLKPK